MTVRWTPVEPLSDEPRLIDYWEPWEPKVGDRVSVRITLECPILPKDGHEMVGTGTVLAINSQPVEPGHFYEVAGEGEQGDPDYVYFGHCAAVELELLP